MQPRVTQVSTPSLITTSGVAVGGALPILVGVVENSWYRHQRERERERERLPPLPFFVCPLDPMSFLSFFVIRLFLLLGTSRSAAPSGTTTRRRVWILGGAHSCWRCQWQSSPPHSSCPSSSRPGWRRGWWRATQTATTSSWRRRRRRSTRGHSRRWRTFSGWSRSGGAVDRFSDCHTFSWNRSFIFFVTYAHISEFLNASYRVRHLRLYTLQNGPGA